MELLYQLKTGDQKVIFTPAYPQRFSRRTPNYTIYAAENGVSDDVIYHLHGRSLDASIWNDDTYFTSLVQAYWRRSSIKPPTVVVFSRGPDVWPLTPKNSQVENGLLNDFISFYCRKLNQKLVSRGIEYCLVNLWED